MHSLRPTHSAPFALTAAALCLAPALTPMSAMAGEHQETGGIVATHDPAHIHRATAAETVGPGPDRKPVANLRGGPLGIERTASAFGRPLPYQSPKGKPGQPVWLRVDLGKPHPIEAVKLYPFWHEPRQNVASHRFPSRFKIEASDNPAFPAEETVVLADHLSRPHTPSVPLQTATFTPGAGRPLPTARYVRLCVDAPRPFFLWRFEVISGGEPVSVGKSFHDSGVGDLNAAFQKLPAATRRINTETVHTDISLHPLARPRRPDGEGVVFDHPEQVTDSSTWKPAGGFLRTPRHSVVLGEGVFKSTFERNIGYLLDSYETEALVYNHLVRDNPNAVPPPKKGFSKGDFWTDTLSGSNAARYLMGAGNTLRWLDAGMDGKTPDAAAPDSATHPGHPRETDTRRLRARLDTIVDTIEKCTRPDGYSYAFPEQRILSPDQDAYTRSWHTQGLIEAGHAGNPKAWSLVRRQGDWFNTCPYLPELFRRIKLGNQGTIANSRTYVDTPIGVPGDIQVIQRYFQPRFWLDQLLARDPAGIWQFPYERTHSYLIATLWSYMDAHQATGDPLYIKAMNGAWEIIHDHFLHPGGSLSISESFAMPFQQYPAGSRLLRASTGETCGNAFWINFNQKHRLLRPGDDAEKYVTQIEKSLYNVLIAAQAPNGDIRYHARLIGRKGGATRNNTCCEGQGTRIYGALPEFIYTLRTDPSKARWTKARDGLEQESNEATGVHVDLFQNSTISWHNNGTRFTLTQKTGFPESPGVTLTIASSPQGKSEAPPRAAIHIRIPSWASAPVDITLNGAKFATGLPGSYVTIDRGWDAAGETLAFTLPMAFKLTKYAGTEPGFAGAPAYALEYGPLLMAATGKAVRQDGTLQLPLDSAELIAKLEPDPAAPLHFSIKGIPDVQFRPYYKLDQETFTTHPFFQK
ncbi:MAG: glycoside hydrolase family 127 protein [Puniceicoccales bacterium]|jgi:hypothetical protein|nr:glycoside hydrolase family 127 protein [Puniceicoccales bacterium]